MRKINDCREIVKAVFALKLQPESVTPEFVNRLAVLIRVDISGEDAEFVAARYENEYNQLKRFTL